MKAWAGVLKEIFGEEDWISSTTMGELYDLLTELYLSNDSIIKVSDFIAYKPERISHEQFERFINRLNNTDLYEKQVIISSSNYIHNDSIQSYYAIIEECEAASVALGYNSTDEMWLAQGKYCKEQLDERSSSVCASITLQFSQTMTMTRQAFRGTLTVFNGNETTAMTDVKLSLTVKDESGNVTTSHEFQINPESLSGFSGELNFTDGWVLDPQNTGVATILFIPTKYAALTVEKRYLFGGTLSYIDPFTGLTVTRDLTPVTLTVKPSPNLDLTYFMQRDILGDDPLTDAVEPCEEAEFSLLINNTGYGDANNVQMVTEQPKIVENEKGLFINFELMSSQLNGKEKTLALGSSVVTDFGTIPAMTTSYAQWWIKSSLLGHFTDYDIEATHVTSYGNPDLSLLNEVTIHELIRSLEISNGTDNSLGFMTNDITDAEDTPDMIYLSNGDIESVATIQNVTIQKVSNTDYTLTVTPGKNGWNYGSVSDPTYGLANLKSIVRNSDGKVIPLRNFWQTDRTLRDGRDPLYENKIHFADEFANTLEETYTLTFEPMPTLRLEVVSIEGVPQEGHLLVEPLDSINVMFNKYINPATFTVDDITLAVQGVMQDASNVAISTADNKTFKIDFSAINDTIGNGYFVLTIQSSEITDSDGFNGKNGKSAGWTMYRDAAVVINSSVNPAPAGTVQCEEQASGNTGTGAGSFNHNAVAYGSAVTLTTVPNEGYEFKNWTLNGEQLSNESAFNYVAVNDMNVVANYSVKSYSVSIDDTADGGSIEGASSGYYLFGDSLTLTAQPNEDYIFVGWSINGVLSASEKNCTFTVNGALNIVANFQRNIYRQSIALARGWNWISSYLNEPLPVNSVLGNATRLIGQFDELVNDPEYGMTGGVDSLMPCSAYKLNVSYAITKTFNGHLHNLENNPIVLRAGWNWISYPYIEEKEIGAVIANASAGDVVSSQVGFSQFANGNWEGTLNTFVPGSGYLYKSISHKQLSFNFTQSSPQPIRAMAANTYDLTPSSSVNIHKYAGTMNVVAKLYQSNVELPTSDYHIYAMYGNECRGESRCIGGNHYLTVYGDEPVLISFIIENQSNGDVYMVKETLTFQEDIIGSRTSPYLLTIGDATAIQPLEYNTHKMKVYSVEGRLIKADATKETLKSLERGIYIIDGQKFVVK